MFIDSMQFMNCSLDKLVKNLSDEDFKYLVEEFDSKNLELLKQSFNFLVLNLELSLVLLIKLFALMINLLSQLLFIGVKMQLMNLLKQILKNINIAKKIIEYFNKICL